MYSAYFIDNCFLLYQMCDWDSDQMFDWDSDRNDDYMTWTDRPNK